MKRIFTMLLALLLVLTVGSARAEAAEIDSYPVIEPDMKTTVTIENGGDVAYFRYTPEYTESYTFSAFGSSDTYGYLYDSEGNQLTNDDDSGEGSNFAITAVLEAGQTYVFAARFYSSSVTGSFDVMLQINHEWNAIQVILAPTCDTDGETLYQCAICNETKTEVTYAGHRFVDGFCVICEAESELVLDFEIRLDMNDDFRKMYLSYTPETTGMYLLSTSDDVTVYVSDAEGNTQVSDGFPGDGDYGEFAYLYADTEYYFEVEFSSYRKTGILYLTLVKVPILPVDEEVQVQINDGKSAFFTYSPENTEFCTFEFVTGDTKCTHCWVSRFGSGGSSGQFSEAGFSYTDTLEAGEHYIFTTNFGDGVESGFYNVRLRTYREIGGICGENLTWKLSSEGVLTISGSGPMYDYNSYDRIPEWKNRGVKTIILQEGITSIGDYAFYNCWELTQIQIPESVTEIGESTFSGTGIASVSIPGSVKIIGNSAFSSCYSLESVQMNEGLEYLGDSVFRHCDALSELTIPSTVSRMNGSVVSGCSDLTSFKISEENPYFVMEDGTVYSADKTLLVLGNSAVSGEYVIPDFVTTIGAWAFFNYDNITNVVFHSKVAEIEESAFQACYGLTELVLPEGIEKVGRWGFYGCSGLEKISIPSSLREVGSLAFCCNWSSLEELHISNLAAWCAIDFGSQMTSSITNPIAYAEKLYINGVETTKIVIPDTVTRIERGTFYDADMITEVVIPTSVTSIGGAAFYGNENLTVTFEENAPAFEIDYPEWAWGDTAMRVFGGSIVTIRYPSGNESWTEEVMTQELGGEITWVPYTVHEIIEEGTGNVVKEGEELAIHIDADHNTLVAVYMDGVLVDPVNYTVTEGSTIITFSPEFLATLAEGDHKVTVEFEDGLANATITVQAYTPGDITGDGKVNNRDAARLMQYLAGWDVEFVEAALDVNGDGKVNNRDAARLMQYLAGWDVEIN